MNHNATGNQSHTWGHQVKPERRCRMVCARLLPTGRWCPPETPFTRRCCLLLGVYFNDRPMTVDSPPSRAPPRMAGLSTAPTQTAL